MKKLDPYGTLKSCPKCGSDDINDYFEEATTRLEGIPLKEVSDQPERITRTCRRCKFSWDESPLDRKGQSGRKIH